MTTLGWVFMFTSLACVWALVIWCYARLLRDPRRDVPRPAKDFHSA